MRKASRGARNVYWQFAVFPPDKEKFQKVLARHGVDTGTTNLSLVCSLGVYPEYERGCPVAEYVKHNAVYVPAYPRLSKRSLGRVKHALELAFSDS